MSIFSYLFGESKPPVEEKLYKITISNSYFTIGDQKIADFIKSEDDARFQIKRINDILNRENGFYNEYSVIRDGRILNYIGMRYPKLRDLADLVLTNFETQNINVYKKFMNGDLDIKNKFTIGGIISDLFKIKDDYINLMELIQNFNYDNKIEVIINKHIQATKEFLLTPICFTKDGKIVETLTIYDMVCWYFENWMRENPIIDHTVKSLEDINEINKITYPLFVEQIKTRYGVGGSNNE